MFILGMWEKIVLEFIEKDFLEKFELKIIQENYDSKDCRNDVKSL